MTGFSTGVKEYLIKQKEHFLRKRAGRGSQGPAGSPTALMEGARDAIFITNSENKITYANEAVLRLFSFAHKSEILNQNWRILLSSGAGAAGLGEDISFTLEDDSHWNGYFMIRRDNGADFPVEISVSINDSGYKMWVCRDYSESLEYISMANKRMAAIDAAGDGIGIVNAEGHLVYMNPSLQSLYRIPTTEIVGYIDQPWLNLYRSDEHEYIQTEILQSLQEHKYWKGDSPSFNSKGEQVHIEMALTLLPDGSIIQTAHNNKDRKLAEEEKEDIQRQFFQAQKMESMGRLAGGIAHDFNNILASMIGYTEFLVDDLPEESESSFHAQQVLQGAYQARKVVEQILVFSRHGNPDKLALDLEDVVQDTLVMLNSTIPSHIRLEEDMRLADVQIHGNKTQISQVLMNLCVNGLDAMAEANGGILRVTGKVVSPEEIEFSEDHYIKTLDDYPKNAAIHVMQKDGGLAMLEYGHLLEGAEYIELRVSDEGHGVSLQILEKIFDPFFTTKAQHKGTGLGLSTVHGIIAGHRGAVTVKSRADEGTEFCLYFPVYKSATPRRGKLAMESGFSGSGHIMLVDDEDKLRMMMSTMLERMGYSVVSFASAEQAFLYLGRSCVQIPDLIISDYSMPYMNGLDLARQLAESYPDIPVMISSGFVEEKLYEMLDDTPNVVAALTKPVPRRILFKSIERVLEKKRTKVG